MDEPILGADEAALDAAERRGQALLATEPRAIAAYYEPITGRIVVDLANGCSYLFPVSLVEDLEGAEPGDLAKVDVDGAGFNLHFPTLDADLFVPSLVAGLFGSRKWTARLLAGHAGRARSPAKAAAARANGAKGGRPRKVGG